MIPVSAKWREAIKGQFRYQGYLWFLLQVSPPGLHENMVVTTDDSETVSDVAVLDDSDSATPTPYATTELNRWLLNGSFEVLPKDAKVDDWWSTMMTDNAKQLVFDFDKTYDIPEIFIEWDVLQGTYPRRISVVGYGATGDEVGNFDVTDISSASGNIDTPMDNVKQVVITIVEMRVPLWRVRINEIFFGVYAKYDSVNNGRIMKAESYDLADPLNAKLPTHTMKVTLRNLDKHFDPTLEKGISKYLARRQIGKFQWGFVTAYGVTERTEQLHYYLDSFTIPKDSKEIQLTTTSRLALLTEVYKLSPYNGATRTLYDLALEVLQRSNVLKEFDGEIPWELSDKLKSFSTTAPVPREAANKILQLIAGAGLCWLTTNPLNGFIKFDEFSSATDPSEVTVHQELGDPEVDVRDQLHTVSIGVYKYSPEKEEKELSKGDYSIAKGDTTLMIDYNCKYAQDVKVAVSGATLVKSTPYSGSVEIVVRTTAATATATITVTGKEVKSSVAYTTTYTDNTITQGLDVTVENPFITSTDKLQEITDWVKKWYSVSQRYTIPYLGYPELTAGDPLEVNTVYGDHSATVLGNKITFNGGFKGTLEVK